MEERERLNRIRTWLTCFCVDISHATQYGKMSLLPVDDYVARNSRDWYRSSQFNLPMDVHLCAYVEMLLIMSKFRAEVQRRQVAVFCSCSLAVTNMHTGAR